ncbi:MAG: hypothetical protein JWO35_273 [Candidatus Saccharibacteria bacterium]|nr:hypothetical protein [Candidatus Saccharibacteria bacterium]
MNHSFVLKRPPTRKLLVSVGLLCMMLAVAWQVLFTPAYGVQLGDRALQIASSEASATTDYRLTFTLPTAGTLGSIDIEFCSNDPFPGTACTAPAGLDASTAVLADQTGATGFSIDGASTTNRIVLTRPPASEPTGPATYHFSGVTSPSTPGSYYARIQTFATADATGPASDYGGLAFAITNAISISATVPPYLIFCTGVTIPGFNCVNASGDYIDFGELSPSKAHGGTSQFLVATNAVDGYGVTVNGTTLTSGNNIIPAMASNDVSRPGLGQFGFNLRANATPSSGSDPSGPGAGQPQSNYNQPNSYRFVSGDSIVINPAADNIRVYTSSYIANIPTIQAPGIYVTTLTYVCLALF